MQSKSLLVAVAAFALTATGVHAYGGQSILNRAGLSSKQVSAIHDAQQLKAAGDIFGARELLVEAGITEETLKAIHEATREAALAVREALRDGDYEAFKVAVGDGQLADLISSETDFDQFREAHNIRLDGEWEDAAELLEELGVNLHKDHLHRGDMQQVFVEQLTEEQIAAFQVATTANDRATMQAIFDEAGIDFGKRRGG